MISENVMDEIKEQFNQMLDGYHLQMEKAYDREPGDLVISSTHKLSPGKTDHETIVETGISFVCERVKDRTSVVVDERQTRIE